MIAGQKDGKIRKGIQSIEIGATILRAVLDAPSPIPLKDIVARTGITPSKAFRYLVSFVDTGLLSQDLRSRRYSLGSLSLELGLAALGRMDEMAGIWDGLVQVSDTLGKDAHFTIWGQNGPMIARWRHGPEEISVRIREGTILPILTSATGRVWACHLPTAATSALIGEELKALADQTGRSIPDLKEDFAARIAHVSKTGLSCADQEQRPGISAMSGPVFGRSGIVCAMTVLSQSGDIDLSMTGDTAITFQALLKTISTQIGK